MAKLEIKVGDTMEYNNDLFGEEIVKFKVKTIKKVSELDSEEKTLLNEFHEKSEYNKNSTLYIGLLTSNEDSFEFIILNKQIPELLELKIY